MARTKNTHELNKVQSDFRVWDLQINPAWVSWGPGSGINCYISWPSSCCLSQPAWLGPGLARNHGLRAQQCGHFPQRKNTGLRGLLSKQDESCQTVLTPTFHKHFLCRHFSFLAPAHPWSSQKVPDRNVTKGWPMLTFSVRKMVIPITLNRFSQNAPVATTSGNLIINWLILIFWSCFQNSKLMKLSSYTVTICFNRLCVLQL